jgi:hypothetical protein
MKIFRLGALSGGMANLAKRKKLVLGMAILLAYILIIQIFTDHNKYDGDALYPLSRWKLFPGTLGVVTSFEVEIVELEGRAFQPPISPAKLGILQGNAGGSAGISRLLSDWGQATEMANVESSESFREIFEETYFPPGKIKYRLVRLQYIPIIRLRSPSRVERVVVREYDRQ